MVKPKNNPITQKMWSKLSLAEQKKYIVFNKTKAHNLALKAVWAE
jgi:hypothetical protein